MQISYDLFFVGKVGDIVELYLNPPEEAPVVYVDEKTTVNRWGLPTQCRPWVWTAQKELPMTT